MARFRLGRKAPLVWSYLQLAVSGAATAYFSSFGAYCVFRFLTGMTFSGIILNSFSLGESSQGKGGGLGGGRLVEGAWQPRHQTSHLLSCVGCSRSDLDSEPPTRVFRDLGSQQWPCQQ